VQRHGLGQPGGFLLAELYDPVDIRGRPAFGFIKEPHNQLSNVLHPHAAG
jgi:hypothetical protein